MVNFLIPIGHSQRPCIVCKGGIYLDLKFWCCYYTKQNLQSQLFYRYSHQYTRIAQTKPSVGPLRHFYRIIRLARNSSLTCGKYHPNILEKRWLLLRSWVPNKWEEKLAAHRFVPWEDSFNIFSQNYSVFFRTIILSFQILMLRILFTNATMYRTIQQSFLFCVLIMSLLSL